MWNRLYSLRPLRILPRINTRLFFSSDSQSQPKLTHSYEEAIQSIQKHSDPSSRLLLGYTCLHCNSRSYRSISKLAYTKGIVIVTCSLPCGNRHLIADHLGWFKDWDSSTLGPNVEQKGTLGTIQDILKRRGESIATNFDHNPLPTQNNQQSHKSPWSVNTSSQGESVIERVPDDSENSGDVK
jgi:protein import protein ZIM17